MSLDMKAISTNGFWVTTASELTVRIASWGYIGVVAEFIPEATRTIKTWLGVGVRHKLRGD